MYNSIYLFLNIGGQEMIFIFVIALFLFGGKKLPEIARGLGRGIREFKDASENIKKDINDQINDFEKDIEKKPSPQNAIAATSASSTLNEEESKSGDIDPDDTDDDIYHSDEYYQPNYDYESSEDSSLASSNDNEIPEAIDDIKPVDNGEVNNAKAE